MVVFIRPNRPTTCGVRPISVRIGSRTDSLAGGGEGKSLSLPMDLLIVAVKLGLIFGRPNMLGGEEFNSNKQRTHAH